MNGNHTPATLLGMAETPARTRMIFDAPERLRRAIKIEAAERNISASELIKRILEANLEHSLARADELIAREGGPREPPPKKKPGRKPKE